MLDESVQEALDKADRLLDKRSKLNQEVYVNAFENIAASLGISFRDVTPSIEGENHDSNEPADEG